jgi:spectinomycin phosphotransferase
LDALAPAPVDRGDLRRSLSEHWGITVDEIRYLPKGAGSHHWVTEFGGRRYFVTVDDLDAKPWIANERSATFEGLACAYEAAWSLHHDAGLAVVVAPIRSRGGSVLLRLSDRFGLAVFPFVEGRPGRWGDALDPPGRTMLLRELATLHTVVPGGGIRLDARPLSLPKRRALDAALNELDQPWRGGPYSQAARQALYEHASAVVKWLEEFDILSGQLQRDTSGLVVTHGEPHPGNRIRTDSGHRLVDWDTAALARPERDLWMVDDGSLASLGLYEDLTGVRPSRRAIRFYRLAWTLYDVAAYTDMFRSPHVESRWLHQKCNDFLPLLRGESSPFKAPARIGPEAGGRPPHPCP